MPPLPGIRASPSPVLCTACSSSGQPACLNPLLPRHCVNVSLGAKLHSKQILRRKREDFAKPLRLSGSEVRASGSDENLDPLSYTTTTTGSEKDVLAAKLAAAEAEAEALKKELALRRAGSKDGDLSKLKISTPEKRIDGTGYREQLFSGPGAKKEPKKWGITEAELFLSKGAPTEGASLAGKAMEADADAIVSRRLVIGLGLSFAALGSAFIKLPVTLTKPSKPLFFYLTYILRLKDQLVILETTESDASTMEAQLKRALGSKEELKENFLSAVALLDTQEDRASKLAFETLEYLSEADYSKYFENLGEPSSSQQVEFIKFSKQSIKAARLKIQEFVSLFPAEAVEAAKISTPMLTFSN